MMAMLAIGVHLFNRQLQLVQQNLIGLVKGRTPGNQDIIETGMCVSIKNRCGQGPQPPLGPVALNGAADPS